MTTANMDSSNTTRRRLSPIVALIGAFGALVIGLLAILNTELLAPPITPVPPSTMPPPSRLIIPCIFGPAHPLLIGPLLAVEGRITSPLHCTDTLKDGSVIKVEGVYDGDLHTVSLWVLVYTHDRSDELFYPQAQDACEGVALELEPGTQHWSTDVHLGKPDTPGLYDIILVATPSDSMKNQMLQEWLSKVCRNGALAGLRIEDFLTTEGTLIGLDTVTVATR